MSQHDMDVANGSGLVVRADINAALQALASQSGGAAAPSPSFPNQVWADTGTGRLKQRNAANSAWLDCGPLDATMRDAAVDGTYVADTGAANAYVCNFVPAITARSETVLLRFKVGNGNTGASTINDGLGTVSLVGQNHAALKGGETIATGIAMIQWNSSAGGSGAYVLVYCTGAAGPAVNQLLTAFTTAGTAPSLTLTPSPAIDAYRADQRFRVKFHAAGGTTLNVSGRGAKSLKQYDSTGAKVAAVTAANLLTDIEYDGTDMVLLNPLPPNTVTSGVVMSYAANAAPTGWLKANGAAVSRTTYAALFAAISTTFGAGDGSTTFNLPDLRGEFVRGWDDGRGIDTGRTFGSAQADAYQSHNHTQTAEGNRGAQATQTQTSAGGGQYSVVIGVQYTGTSGGTETRPRNIALLYCIKI